MNRDDRRKLARAARSYCTASLQAENEFSAVVRELQENEEKKLDHIPENLQSGGSAESIEEAVDLLSSVIDSLDSIKDLRDEIAEQADIDISDIHTLLNEKSTAVKDGARRNRFQILLSDQSLCLMRLRSLQLGISCNELICTALQNELLKQPGT